MLEKIVESQKSRCKHCDFTKKNSIAQILTRKMTGNGMNQNPENWQGVKYGNQACNNTTIDEIWGGYTQIKK